MKRVLLSILNIVLLIIIFFTMKAGIKIGPIELLGFQGIADKNQNLTETITKSNEKNNEYSEQVGKVESDSKKLASAKKDYLDLVQVSTDSEIQEAMQIKTYTIEYLWSRVGNHATQEGTIVTMNVVSSSLGDNEYRNLNFTVTGSYLAICNFIYDLENDSKLDFTIDEFDMKASGTAEVATFVVKNVKIIKENTSSTNDTGNTVNNTNTNKTTDDNSTHTQSMVNSVSNTFKPIQ